MAGRNKTLAIIAGGIAGATALVNTARVVTERTVVRRREANDDPYVDEPFGELPSDRHYTVTATDGTPLYVEEVGPMDAEVTVVFAHGYTLRFDSFHFQRLALSALDDPRLRLVFYDQRAHGRSGECATDSCTIDQLGSDLEQVLEAATDDGAKVFVVGHSMGGMTIMALADRRPELFGGRILGTVLLSTSAGGVVQSLGSGFAAGVVQQSLGVLARGARLAPRSIERVRRLSADTVWLLIRKYSFGARGAPASIADFVDTMIAATPLEVVADFYPTLSEHNKFDALVPISKGAVLVMCGDEDQITPLAQSEEIAREIERSKLIIVPGTGHMAMLEEPGTFNHAIIDFIKENLAPRRKRRA